jgi:hypothetical protein
VFGTAQRKQRISSQNETPPGNKKATTVRFELTRSMSNGLAIHRLNHSATSSRNMRRFLDFLFLFLRCEARLDQVFMLGGLADYPSTAFASFPDESSIRDCHTLMIPLLALSNAGQLFCVSG